ncbi:MAG: gluconokinase [Ancrocorticia sp.]|jgi:gluconokinase|nr:gluconokinase [Ancrocorticia sp.]MCI1896027.1 gluconokinase [Ancrocorticia sp.]MCI1932723.1 gluconokinase [Ancrocorticia sp.]MCI1963811.1 gluconokinase [Ancrocorticia sp.]MCI2002149.1 gluconokinase [Ancrocorticia sp.]
MSHEHLIVMGVCGSGKTTVARALAAKLNWDFAEGDDFHSQANRDKMRAGIPLTDDDRWPWLDTIVEWTAQEDGAGKNTVVTCSALKRSYRDRLRRAPGRTFFVHLTGSPELLAQRMAGRTGHYMPTSLLPSQLATLEELGAEEPGFAVGIDARTEGIVARIEQKLHEVGVLKE